MHVDDHFVHRRRLQRVSTRQARILIIWDDDEICSYVNTYEDQRFYVDLVVLLRFKEVQLCFG